MTEQNRPIVEEFRANAGRLGGQFEGRTMLLLRHRGVRTGVEYVAPLGYLSSMDDTMYVFASNSGKPQNPQWYRNVMATGRAEVEVGAERFRVVVEEITGPERDRLVAEQIKLAPPIAASVQRAAGVRVIPVLALRALRI